MLKAFTSFRGRTTALAVAALVFGMALSAAIAFNNFNEYAKQEQRERAQTTLSRYQDSLEQFVERNRSALLYTAGSEVLQDLPDNGNALTQVLSPFFIQFHGAFPDAECIAFARANGVVVRSAADNPSAPTLDSVPAGWFKDGAALQAGQVALTDLYENPTTGQPTASLVTPIMGSSGELVGVLAMGLDMARLQDLSASNKLGEFGYVFASMGGRYFAHGDRAVVGGDIPQELRAVERVSAADVIRFANEGRSVVVDNVYLPELDLTLWVVADEGELVKPVIDSVVQISASTVLIVLASLVLIRLVMIKMSLEIGDLVRVSHDMSHGKFHARARTQTSREFTELASSLNTLAATIQARTEDLESSLKRLQSSYQEIVSMLSTALEANDDTTQGHCARVQLYCLRMGDVLELQAGRLAALNSAALLHDVGKIGVPSWILNKEGPLDESEIGLMRRHPEIGHRILMGSAGMAEVAEIVYQHHEWYNGGGYPDGLSGNGILIESRILSVVDTYDAMTCVRPYRKQPLTRNQAIARLRAGAGTQFDPELVELFVGISEDAEAVCAVPA